ncbi:hypothetical protein Q3G72_023003 [Acer saccharum]|nr:hypothetical protein Q3G72_023003 [Acer saccharum]
MFVEERVKGTQTFVEVVQRKNEGTKATKEISQEKILTMSWSSRQCDNEWLNRCVVGTLKAFSGVASVNFRRIPLSFWNSAFFMRLGWTIGEPLLIDDETTLKKRFDKGRILVLVQQEKLASVKVKVEAGLRSFLADLQEDEVVVDWSWVEKQLGLDPSFDDLRRSKENESRVKRYQIETDDEVQRFQKKRVGENGNAEAIANFSHFQVEYGDRSGLVKEAKIKGKDDKMQGLRGRLESFCDDSSSLSDEAVHKK